MTLDYVLRRVFLLIAVIFLAVSLNFFIPRLSPINPIRQRMQELAAQGGVNAGKMDKLIAAYEKKFGLDQPLWKQYMRYWGDISRLDLGSSITFFPAKVKTEIIRAMPWTIGLLVTTSLIGFALGTFFGAALSWPSMRKIAGFAVPLLMTLSAIPFYLLGFALLYLLVIVWPIFPFGGAVDIGHEIRVDWATLTSILKHAFLPAIAIILGAMGFSALGMRGMMITTMGEDYINMAEYKGLPDRVVFLRYALRNAMLPQFTGFAIGLTQIMAGAVLVELLFSYPGVGFLLFRAVQGNDYFLIQGVVLFIILSVAIGLFVMDMVYPFLDPRIRYRRA